MNAAVRFDFEGSVAIVTGAARGVGRALVGEFVRARAQVVAADRDEDGLAETCAPYGERVASIVADVSAPEGRARSSSAPRLALGGSTSA